jgi:hypothetical protein
VLDIDISSMEDLVAVIIVSADNWGLTHDIHNTLNR